MANKSRFVIAESSIKAFFLNNPQTVFSREELGEILEARRSLWNLPVSMNTDRFVEKLVLNETLQNRNIVFSGYGPEKQRLIKPNATAYEFAVSLVNRSFLSHFSAVFLHGLTNQVPKTIYISFEQSKKNRGEQTLTQAAIDAAFAKPQRRSATTAVYDDYTLLLHSGMYTNRTGITIRSNLPVTNIERTLIDITVRPGYAGGVFSVLEVYRRALDKISINKLAALLDKYSFLYPYHQAIGFYLEKAGLQVEKLDVFRNKIMALDFYLTYEMTEKAYNSTWKIYHPTGM